MEIESFNLNELMFAKILLKMSQNFTANFMFLNFILRDFFHAFLDLHS